MPLRPGSPQMIAVRERQAQVLDLRRQGYTYQQIVDMTTYKCVGSVQRALSSAMKAIVADGVTELRALECERYDVALRAIWGKVETGDLDAIGVFLRISSRRAKLMGLDAPARIAPTSPDGLEPYSPKAMSPQEVVDTYAEAMERALSHDS